MTIQGLGLLTNIRRRMERARLAQPLEGVEDTIVYFDL